MKRYAPLYLCLALVFMACSGKQSKESSLEGEWVPQTAELGGMNFNVSNFAGATLVLAADSYDFAGDKGTYTILAKDTPAKLDIHGVEGPNAGRDIPAIFQLNGDELVVCYQLGTGDRPTEFKTHSGTQEFLVRYKRGTD